MNTSTWCNRICRSCNCDSCQDSKSRLMCYQVGLIKILEHISILFERDKIPFWLMYGTLLGARRNHQMIPWDFDIDLGFWDSDGLKILALRSEINSPGYHLASQSYEEMHHPNLYVSLSKNCKHHVDLFPWEIRGEVAHSMYGDHTFCPPMDLRNLTKIEFEGKKYTCPNHVDEFLDRNYHSEKNWRDIISEKRIRVKFLPYQERLKKKYNKAIVENQAKDIHD